MRACPQPRSARRARRPFRGLSAALVAYGALAGSQLVLDGCTNIITTGVAPTTIGPGTTSMSVDPNQFLGHLVCSSQPGGVQSYVATVTEVLRPCADGSNCRSGTCIQGTCADVQACVKDSDCVRDPSPGACLPTYCSNKPVVCTKPGDTDECRCDPATDAADCQDGVCLATCVDNPICADDAACKALRGTPAVCLPGYCDVDPSVACDDASDCSCAALHPDAEANGVACDDGQCRRPCSETFTLASSPATSCAQSAYFQYLTVGSGYVADIDAYTQPADELVPVCGDVGPSKSCDTDADCPAAFGCAGRCLYLIYENPVTPDPTCITQCQGDEDCIQACGLATDFSKPLTPCAGSPPPEGGVWSCTCNYVATEGDRNMYSRATQAPVARQWTTPEPCGAGSSPPRALAFVNVSIAPCLASLTQADGGAGPTVTTGTVAVVPSAALPSSLICAGGVPPGTVTSFDVVPADPAIPAQTGVPCQSGAEVTFPDLRPGRCQAFKLTAHIAGADGGPETTRASWCTATPVVGVTVSAMCDLVVPGGAGGDSPCP